MMNVAREVDNRAGEPQTRALGMSARGRRAAVVLPAGTPAQATTTRTWYIVPATPRMDAQNVVTKKEEMAESTCSTN